MKPIYATVENGKLTIPSEYNQRKMSEWKKEYKYFSITPHVRESKKQRGFYHGAICALYAYFHEKLDHHSHEDLETVHQWLKIEFNPEYITINGKSHLVGMSTQGKLNDGFMDRCIEGLMDNYDIDPEVLNPEKYKYWRDVVYVDGGADNYLDYLVETKLLKKPKN